MKITCCCKDGRVETLELVGPIRVVSYPSGIMDIIHDEGTGNDYWFDKVNGYFDGFGCSVAADNLTETEAKALMQGLKEMHEGRTRPLSEIRDDLAKKGN